MALTQRQEEILTYLKKNRFSKVKELAKKMYVSDATIRRDLQEMSKLGLLERNHGGAVILQNSDEVSIYVRMTSNLKSKEEVAVLASSTQIPYRTIFIDNSSTAYSWAIHSNLKHKTVFTNSIVLANELSKSEEINIILLGGSLSYNSNSLTGSITNKLIPNFHFDLFVCSCTCFSLDGVYESSIDQSTIKQLVKTNSDKAILLVDKTKLNKKSTYKTYEPSEFDYIYTNASDEQILSYKEIGLNIYNK